MRSNYKQKYWEIHPGKNSFFCGGRCVSASNVSVLCLSFWLIIINSGLFFAFDCRIMVKYSVLIPIFAVLLFISVLSTLLKTAFSDPGIIARATVTEAEWIELGIAQVINSSQADPNRNYIRIKEVYINRQLIKLKYCTTCKIFRPPRSSHCSVCDNCVERFDHHCPWVGNCIGKRNYRYFFFFNFFLTIYCVYILAVSISNLVLLSMENNGLWDALKISPTSAAIIVVAFFTMVSVFGLSGFHCNLICQEISTNEDLKGSYKKMGMKNPYSRGNMCKNCAWIICGPRQPSLLMSTQEIDLQNLPIGCSYRGTDGCLIGPIGSSKTLRDFIEDRFSSNTNAMVKLMEEPIDLKNINILKPTNNQCKVETKSATQNSMDSRNNTDIIVIKDSTSPPSYGTIYPADKN